MKQIPLAELRRIRVMLEAAGNTQSVIYNVVTELISVKEYLKSLEIAVQGSEHASSN